MSNEVFSHQVKLSWSRVFKLAVRSIKKRFTRSILTMGSVVLAIAFLMSIWINTSVVDGLKALNDADVNAELLRNGVDLTIRGMSSKDVWLISLSLLVCSVGILNAMLMSVTERFREIGTMKCLGALDSVIIRMFIIEAGILGFIGTFMGTVIGALIGLFTGLVMYGIKSWAHFNWLTLAGSSFTALATGIILCIVFAIYPAFVAASMQPVDAMRVEE